ncbi:hypothetical protein PBN151_0049 [Paenibacillus sp. NAIST15-1]|nr:hypothetical protein PBN151_0049 [Paenibacillus sp. NAIST15-1]
MEHPDEQERFNAHEAQAPCFDLRTWRTTIHSAYANMIITMPISGHDMRFTTCSMKIREVYRLP